VSRFTLGGQSCVLVYLDISYLFQMFDRAQPEIDD